MSTSRAMSVPAMAGAHGGHADDVTSHCSFHKSWTSDRNTVLDRQGNKALFMDEPPENLILARLPAHQIAANTTEASLSVAAGPSMIDSPLAASQINFQIPISVPAPMSASYQTHPRRRRMDKPPENFATQPSDGNMTYRRGMAIRKRERKTTMRPSP